MESCRTCREPYDGYGDGWDGECPTCADRTESVRLATEAKANPAVRAAARKCLAAQLALFDAAREVEQAIEGVGGEIDGLRDLVEQFCCGLGIEDANGITEAHIDALLDEAVPTPVLLGGIIATFVPQAWVNNLAVRAEPKGPVEFDVTEAILAMSREDALALRDDQYETDDLRDHGPRWMREWDGPFRVEVADAIQGYYDHQDEQEAK